jgi:flagellar biosynthetic protein FliR
MENTILNLETLTALAMFHYFLLFCRIGSAIMLLPGFGESYVPPTIRALLALFITLVVYLPLKGSLPPEQPENLAQLTALIFAEISVGLFIGMMIRILISVWHIVGMLIALQSGLASAVLFDPNQGGQGAIVGIFLSITALVLLFATDTHHLMLLGIIDSYQTFAAGKIPPLGDFSDFAAKTLSSAFKVAFMISAPVMVVTLFMNVMGGIMGRLMPAMQVFFIMMPVQILVSFIILMITFSAGMLWYMRYFKDSLAQLFSLS